MICEDVELCLSAWVDGELDAEEAAAIDDHVRSCPLCRRRLDALKGARDMFRTLAPAAPAALPAAHPPRYYAPILALAIGVGMLLLVARSADVPAVTLLPEPQFVPGLDCRVTEPGPGCRIDLPPTPCSSALDCSALAP
jgi:Putative zinc-finger